MHLHKIPFIIEIETLPTLLPIDYKKPETLKAIGQSLWGAIENKEAFKKLYENSGTTVLSIEIQSDKATVQALPWELLYASEFGGFLAKNPKFILTRTIPNLPQLETTFEQKPLRILFFSTLPDDIGESERLAVENEQIAVTEALLPSIKEGLVELQIPNDGRFESLRHHIENFKPHLVFLHGHSSYSDGKGYFLFEDKKGQKVHIDEEKLTEAFIGSNVGCVVLSSCQSAQADERELKSGLARSLAFKGIKNVIGMSDSIFDKAGATFANYFVASLAKQQSVATALQKAREGISKLDGEFAKHWHLPLLLSQDIQTPLVDWDFEPKAPKREMTLQTLNQISFDKLFIGRRKEFRLFYNKLYDNKLKKLLIFGEGGMGKTAMVAHFALKLRAEGYKVFDYSLKHGGDFDDFLFDIELELNEANTKTYEKIKERCQDEQCRAKRLVKLLLSENKKITFIFDNLESIQNPQTKELEEQKLKAWIEVLSNTDDVVLLMTSRWLLPECKEYIALTRPLKSDFLYYVAINHLDMSERAKVDKLYETLGGNFRGTKFFVEATKGMSLEDEKAFLEKLSKVEEEMQIDMAIEQILSTRTQEEIELLRRLTVYPHPVIRGGVIKISNDLPKEALDTLVSFSLVEESLNSEYEVKEYQISALVFGFIAKGIALSLEIKRLASEFQLYMFHYERKTLTQALIVYEILNVANERYSADRFALEWIVRNFERNGFSRELVNEWLPNIAESDDITIKAEALNLMGKAYVQLGKYIEAEKYIQEALKLYEKLENNEEILRCLFNIGTIHRINNKLEIAFVFFQGLDS